MLKRLLTAFVVALLVCSTAVAQFSPVGRNRGANPTASFQPNQIAACVGWYDPYDLTTLSMRNVLALNGTNQYLSSSTLGALPYSGASGGISKFSIGGWVWFGDLGSSCPANQVIFGGFDNAGKNGSVVLMTGNTSHRTYLEANIFTNQAAGNFATCNLTWYNITALKVGQWYRLDFVFDGSQATDGTKAVLYINGAAVAHDQAANTNAGARIYNSSANFGFGAIPDFPASRSYLNGYMSDWTYYNSALSAANITTLWNNGTGIPVRRLKTTSLTGYSAAWPMDQTSGTRTDLAATYNLTANNSPGYLASVDAWTPKCYSGLASGQALPTLTPWGGPAGTLQGAGGLAPGGNAGGPYVMRAWAPFWSPTGRNGKPGVSFYSSQYLYGKYTAIQNHVGGSMLFSVHFPTNSTIASECTIAGFHDDETLGVDGYLSAFMQTPTQFLDPEKSAGYMVPCFRLKNLNDNGNLGAPNGQVYAYGGTEASLSSPGHLPAGNTPIVAGAEYKMEYAMINDGTQATSSSTSIGPYRFYVNNALQSGYNGDGGGSNQGSIWGASYTGASSSTNPCLLTCFMLNGHAGMPYSGGNQPWRQTTAGSVLPSTSTSPVTAPYWLGDVIILSVASGQPGDEGQRAQCRGFIQGR